MILNDLGLSQVGSLHLVLGLELIGRILTCRQDVRSKGMESSSGGGKMSQKYNN